MIGLVLAILVAALMGTGAYLVLQRSPIRLVLGLTLLTHGVNLLLFGTGALRRGLPPVVLNKATYQEEIGNFVDPLPQALILTAIVISFGIMAFIIALLNRRNSLEKGDDPCTERTDDPFALGARHELRRVDEDYEWLEDAILSRPAASAPSGAQEGAQ